MTIRFIVDTTSSLTDVYGNRYHFATVTSVKTGKSITLDHVGGPSNAEYYVKKLTGTDWSEIHRTTSDKKIREFNRARKYLNNPIYEHNLTAEMLADLENDNEN